MAEYINRDDALLHSEIIRVYSKDYGNIDVVPVEYLADIPAADVQPVDRWISVKDRLPDDCVEVLVHDTDCGILIGWYDKKDSIFVAEFINELDAVTHWQPLPSPPKDGDTE